MPLLDLNEERDVRVGALLLGHVKLGIYNGRHPQATETFRFTSSDRQRLEPLAADFGGEIRSFRPQGAGTDSWELVSEVDAFTATFPFADAEWNMTQDWKLWRRSGLERLCDGFDCTVYTVDDESGERESEDTGCICSAKGKRECSAETRVRFLLAQTGLGVWELQTGSKIAAMDLHDQMLAIASIAAGRMNQIPVRVTYAPREISYIEDGKRHKATKRLVSLSVAGDAASVLKALQLKPQAALFQAVATALHDAGRELVGMSPSPALAPGEEPPADQPAPLGEGGQEAAEDEAGEEPVSREASGLDDDAGSEPATEDEDSPATDEAWERATRAGLTGTKAKAIAKGLGITVRSATDISGPLLAKCLSVFLDTRSDQ